MKFILVCKQESDASKIVAKTDFKGADVVVWAIESQSAPIAAIKDANVIITVIDQAPFTITKPTDAAYPLEPAKANVINNALGFIPSSKQLDIIAEAYKTSGSKAVIINAGSLSDFAVGYLYKKHNIVSYGALPKAKGIVNSLVSQIKINGIEESNIEYKAAGVGNLLWLYQIKDKNGRDLYPLFRVGAGDESLNMLRAELINYPAKTLRFFGYYNSAQAIPQNTDQLATDICNAITSGTVQNLYLSTINKGYIYGIDEFMPVAVNCVVKDASITPQKADLPLQCVLASNDYAGAFLTAVSALATKSATQIVRALKLDPYIASLLALDEADALAASVLQNTTVSAFFGGK